MARRGQQGDGMRGRRTATVAALGATLSLAACAIGSTPTDPYQPIGTRPVDDSFRVFTTEQKFEGRVTHAIAFVRIMPHEGKVAFCGAYAYDGDQDFYQAVSAAFGNVNSTVRITPATGSSMTMLAGALAENDRSMQKTDAPVMADCSVLSGASWNDSYAMAKVAFNMAEPYAPMTFRMSWGEGPPAISLRNGQAFGCRQEHPFWWYALVTVLGGIPAIRLACAADERTP